MKSILLLITVFVLIGCNKPSQETSSIGEFEVEKLFTKDGCTVYRFFDNRMVYFTNCDGSTSYNESCGKGCSKQVEVD